VTLSYAGVRSQSLLLWPLPTSLAEAPEGGAEFGLSSRPPPLLTLTISEVPPSVGEQASSPHQAHLLGFCPKDRDVIPRSMGLNGDIVPSLSRVGSGRGQGRDWECPRCHTGRLCPPPPPTPSLPSYLVSPSLSLLPWLLPWAPSIPGAMQLLHGWGSGQLCRSKVSPPHHSILWRWASPRLGPALPAQLCSPPV
jgi:hypothetical protein